MNDSDLKTMLAQAESHYSRYEWDEAITCFEAVLRAHANHGAAAQGLAEALRQKQVETELAETITEARFALDAQRFSDALAALNRAQTRAAMRHILKYHAEIDGLRTQAQESLEWQRRVDMALAEARRLTVDRQLDAALHVLDTTWHGLTGRGLEALGQALRRERDRLWAERDLEQRINDAQNAFTRHDYRLAHEFAGALAKEFPEREDLRRMYERFGLVWNSFQSRLAAVHEALAAGRTDDAVAILATTRRDWSDNPDWQALWLQVHMEHARRQFEAGRAAMAEHRFDEATVAFASAASALNAALDVFAGHPTAALERDEAEALHAAAAAAAQAARDRAAGRWDAAWRGWQAADEKLRQATRARGREFGEVTAVVGGMLRDAGATVAAIEQARLLLAEGQGALAEGDAGRARECFREGLSRTETGSSDLQEQLQAGLRAADHAQREVKAWLGRAERTQDDLQSLALLRRAYARWRTAPGLAERLAGRLLAVGRRALAGGDEAAAADYCAQVLSLSEATGEQHAEAALVSGQITARQQARTAVAEATRLLADLQGQGQPPAAAYQRVLETLNAVPWQDVPELQAAAAQLRQQAQERYARLAAAEPYLVRAEVLRQAGDWDGATAALEEALSAQGDRAAGAARSSPLAQRLATWQTLAAALKKAMQEAEETLGEAQLLYGAAAAGELAAVDWPRLTDALERAAARLAEPPPQAEPLPRAWNELETRRKDLAARVAVLHEAHVQVEAGRGLEALPMLLQAVADGARRDPVLNAVLQRLQRQVAKEAGTRAEALAAEAREAVARGEMAEARRRLAGARLYASGGPQLLVSIETVERQVTAIERMARLALEAGQHAGAASARAEALAVYRTILQLATGEEAGFPAAARQDLSALLQMEDGLWDAVAARAGEARLNSLSQAGAADLLIHNHLLAPLRLWWKLALAAATADFITAHLFVGDPAAAYARAREAFALDPRDAALRELFVRARHELWDRRQCYISRRVSRARRLAERGAYAQALAELQPALDVLLQDGAETLAAGEPLPEELARVLADADDLRLDLTEAQNLAGRLAPIIAGASAALAENRLEKAAGMLEEAGVIDSERRCAVLWRTLDRIAALIATRQAHTAATRLDELVARAEAAVDLCRSSDEAVAILEQLAAAGAAAARLVGPEGDRLRDRLAALQARAAASCERLEQLETALLSARQAGEAGAAAQQVAALRRAGTLARGKALEAVQAEMARLRAEPASQIQESAYDQPADLFGSAVAPPNGTHGQPRADREVWAPSWARPGVAVELPEPGQDLDPGTVSPALEDPGANSPGDDLQDASLHIERPAGDAESVPEPATSEPDDAPVEVEVLATFDVHDWMSNVMPVVSDEDDDADRRRLAGGTR